MAEKKSAYERMMEKARGGSSKGKGRPPASSVAKAKEVVKEAAKEAAKEGMKEEMEVDVKVEEIDAKMEGKKAVASSVAEKVALLTKKETEFDPEAAAFWKPEEHVPFLFLASAFDSKFGMTFLLIPMFRCKLSMIVWSVYLQVK